MTPNKKRAAILTNGLLPYPETARRHVRAADWLVCADGGARHAIDLGFTPDVVVGDFDSLSPELCARLQAAGVRMEKHPARKDETDLELALDLAVAEGAQEIDVLATLGGRLDQSLANVLLLVKSEWKGIQIRLVEGPETAWLVRAGSQVTVSGQAGDTLSLVPLSSIVTGVNLDGVEWPLKAATLQMGSTFTISNKMSGPHAQLELAQGMVLVVHRALDAS
jgi:thiamine pyrophosphokinase